MIDLKPLLSHFNLDAIYGVDAETYWASDYSLSDKKRGTTDYIIDDRFELQLMSVRKDSWAKPKVMERDEFIRWARTINWARAGFLAHHAHFDGLIASHHCGVRPAMYFDTLSMARPLMPISVGGSLKNVCAAFGRDAKQHSDALTNTKGKRWAEFTKDEKKNLKVYGGEDIDDTWFLFEKLLPYLPLDELALIDLTVKMYAQPSILVDKPAIGQVLINEIARKKALVLGLGLHKSLPPTRVKGELLDDYERTKKHLTSGPKFAEQLKALGITPPTKVSKKKSEAASEKAGFDVEIEGLALSKQDQEFKDLLAHPKKKVRDLVEARFAVSSNILESRCRLLESRAHIGPQPVYLNYYGAKTGRWSGGDNANWQNLSSKRREGGAELRASVHAPSGHSLIIADLAQIEARVNAWFCGQQNVVETFRAYDHITGWTTDKHGKPKPIRSGPDVYRVTAADNIYNKHVDLITEDERFLGKACVAEGTLVVCEHGLKPIEQVTTKDRVWDGENWNHHSGLLSKGLKETVLISGVWLTPDHEVFTGATWQTAGSLLHDVNTRTQALDFAAANLPSLATLSASAACSTPSSNATVDVRSTPCINGTSGLLKAHDATHVQKRQREKKGTGSTPKRYLTTSIVADCLIACRQLFRGVINQVVRGTNTTVAGEYKYSTLGGLTGLHFCSTSNQSQDGTTPQKKWTGSTTTMATSPATSGLSHEAKTQPTNAVSEHSKLKTQVYDLLSCGPKQRFMVVGSDGRPLIVHNCVLALGFQAGWQRFAAMLRIGALGPPIDITDSLAEDIHTAWRQANPFIVANWRATNNKVKSAFIGLSTVQDGVVTYQGVRDPRTKQIKGWMHLPGGMAIRYDDVQIDANGKDYSYIGEFRRNKFKPPTIKRVKLYGGIEVENRTQALARKVITEHMLGVAEELKGKVRIAMSTHDEIVGIVPNRWVNKALGVFKEVMSQPPDWAPDLPVAVDAHISQRYDK